MSVAYRHVLRIGSIHHDGAVRVRPRLGKYRAAPTPTASLAWRAHSRFAVLGGERELARGLERTTTKTAGATDMGQHKLVQARVAADCAMGACVLKDIGRDWLCENGPSWGRQRDEALAQPGLLLEKVIEY